MEETAKKYKIIYADPPWSYYNDMTVMPDCTTVKGMRRPPYKVMSSSDIRALKVQELADQDCILFIWTTDYHLEKCMEVIKAWGFEYKTIGFSWAKKNKQGKPVCFTGAYTLKSGTELCLLATRGKNAPKLVVNRKVRGLVESPREEHSKKPAVVRDRITELVGDVSRVELFARQATEGWEIWGDQVESTIKLD